MKQFLFFAFLFVAQSVQIIIDDSDTRPTIQEIREEQRILDSLKDSLKRSSNYYDFELKQKNHEIEIIKEKLR